MMKKSLVIASLLFLASLSVVRADQPNVSTDQINQQGSFLLLAQNDRDTKLTNLLIGGSNRPIGAGCSQSCETDSHCNNSDQGGCRNCINGKCAR